MLCACVYSYWEICGVACIAMMYIGPVHHTFDVTVSGVRGLSVFNNTVWGEADCFVQYHFPRIAEQRSLEEEEGEGEGGFSECSLYM